MIRRFSLFNRRLKKLALVVIDNASIHTGNEFEEEIERGEEEELYVKFLPPYCPELNLMETLWHKIKYEWLPNEGAIKIHRRQVMQKMRAASLADLVKMSEKLGAPHAKKS